MAASSADSGGQTLILSKKTSKGGTAGSSGGGDASMAKKMVTGLTNAETVALMMTSPSSTFQSATGASTMQRRRGDREPWTNTFRAVEKRYKCKSPAPSAPRNDWFDRNKHELEDTYQTEVRNQRAAQTRSLSPDALVLFKQNSQIPSPQTRTQMAELERRIKSGEKWSLAPNGNNSLDDPATQMKQLEEFKPRPMLDSMADGLRTYKMGKYTEDALIPWDYHRERSMSTVTGPFPSQPPKSNAPSQASASQSVPRRFSHSNSLKVSSITRPHWR